MRKSRFKDEQIVAILRETDRDAVQVVAKRHGVSEQTIYTWKKRNHANSVAKNLRSRTIRPGV